jgi:hypothetical protein
MKFKMAATAGLSLTLDPMGKMFQNASSMKPLGQFPAVAAILNFISDLKFGLLQLLELRSINKIAIIWWLTYKN